MPRHTRRLRTLRGGGTSSWTFAPSSADKTMNNPMAWAPAGSGGPATYNPVPASGGGLPGMQRGGGGGTHYGFTGSGLAGGYTSMPTNCALPQSGASGQLNLPQVPQSGGRRRRNNRNSNRSRRNNRKTSVKSSRRSRSSRSRR